MFKNLRVPLRDIRRNMYMRMINYSSTREIKININEPQDSHYEVLDIGVNATTGEIKESYYTLVKQLHPDTNPQFNSDTEDRFQQIQEAYSILSNSVKRKAYDIENHFNIDQYEHNLGEDMNDKYKDIDSDYIPGGMNMKAEYLHERDQARIKRKNTLNAHKSEYFSILNKFNGVREYNTNLRISKLFYSFLCGVIFLIIYYKRRAKRNSKLIREIDYEQKLIKQEKTYNQEGK